MPRGVYKRKPWSEEHKANISKALKGRVISDETRQKLRIAQTGHKRKGWKLSEEKREKYRKMTSKTRFQKGHKINIGRKLSEESRLKLSKSHIGKKLTVEARRKIGLAHLGKKLSNEQRIKIGNSNRGEKCHFWKGGITKVNMAIRSSLEYTFWREAVFNRDNYTCIWCGERGGKLNADHIKPFAYYPELRFAIDNGRTLCVPCHKTTDTFAGKGFKRTK